MKQPDHRVGPWDFPPGTPAWTGAMLELERKKREPKKAVSIVENGVLKHEYECEGMENDIVVEIVGFGGDGKAPEAREGAAPQREAATVEQQQGSDEIAAGTAPEKSEPSERLAGGLSLDEARRRPLVRRPPYRRHRWAPSAYG
jgi:hypothetical protein